MFYFVLHFSSELANAHDLRNGIKLAVVLQVFADALCTEQFNTFEAHVANDFGRMGFAVVGREGRFADGAGAGEKGPGVALVGGVCVEPGVLLV